MSGLYELALSIPWCMTADALEAMLSIALREPLPSAEIASRMHGKPGAVALKTGVGRDNSTMTVRDGVALLPIDGPIYRYADFFTQTSGGVTTEALAKDLQAALDDPSIKAVLLVIDSPGGEATGIGELADAIYAARSVKPIGAYVEGFGASAAYWLASAASVIGLDASAAVGSIGTIFGVADPTKRSSSSITFVSKQSPKKRPDPTTESGKAVLQQLVDDWTEIFIESVMRNRNLTYEQVTALGGGLAIGQQAIEAGFADELTSEEAMLAQMRDMAQPRLPNARMSRATQQENDQVKISDMWAGFFKAAKAEGIEIEADEGTHSPALAAHVPDPQIAALQAELAKVKAESISRDAQAFAQKMIRENRATPAEASTIIDLYTRAASMSDASLLTSVQAAYQSRPAHQLTQELLPPDGNVLASDRSPSAGDERAETARLLAMTSLGREVAKRKAGQN